MRHMLAFVLVVCMAGAAFAAAPQTSNQLQIPMKSDSHVLQNPVADRQGGETIATAVPIAALPFNDTGATCDNINDYDAVCPYSGSTSPDVVYSLYLDGDTSLTVDLCGSGYDTKTYVLDAGLTVLACNDDFYFDAVCGVYVSKIDAAFIPGGQTVYIVVDGYGSDCGDYIIEVTGEIFIPCVLECPDGGTPEGEPPLVDNYADEYNGGCNSVEFGAPIQALEGTGDNTLVFCGKAGFYPNQGSQYRDTDWFSAVLAEDGPGFIEITLDAEKQSVLYELFIPSCDAVSVGQAIDPVGPCSPQTMTIFGSPGDVVFFFVGASWSEDYFGQVDEWNYIMTITGLADGIIATEDATWSDVKGLYR